MPTEHANCHFACLMHQTKEGKIGPQKSQSQPEEIGYLVFKFILSRFVVLWAIMNMRHAQKQNSKWVTFILRVFFLKQRLAHMEYLWAKIWA